MGWGTAELCAHQLQGQLLLVCAVLLLLMILILGLLLLVLPVLLLLCLLLTLAMIAAGQDWTTCAQWQHKQRTSQH
jgi:hypothetical protein